MAEKWIQGAIKHPGALHAAAARLGIKKSGGTFSVEDLDKLMGHANKTGDTHLSRMVTMARTMAKMHK